LGNKNRYPAINEWTKRAGGKEKWKTNVRTTNPRIRGGGQPEPMGLVLALVTVFEHEIIVPEDRKKPTKEREDRGKKSGTPS